jgi:adenosylmethionine-8-amino-7-oxononanoate aminotransferase
VSAALENRGHLICGEEVPSASGAQFYDVDPSAARGRCSEVELVADRDAGKVAAAAHELGVIVRASGTKIVMSPLLVIEQDDADRVIDVLAQGLEAV